MSTQLALIPGASSLGTPKGGPTILLIVIFALTVRTLLYGVIKSGDHERVILVNDVKHEIDENFHYDRIVDSVYDYYYNYEEFFTQAQPGKDGKST